ncbi:MAG: DMT family transporter [Alphaproteobacteria bacterium]|nr:DMT family transporter [Alphaproteobacteria bacterium]
MARMASVPMGQIMLICGVGSMAVIFLASALRGKLDRLQPHRPIGLLAIGLCQVASFSFWMLALPLLPLANMYVVSFMAPMAVAILAVVFLKEPLGWKRAASIFAGFVGVVVAVNPSTLSAHGGGLIPYLFLFGNMAASALLMFLLRVVADKESSESTSFYARAALAVGGLVLCAATGFVAMKPHIFLALCGSGALGGAGWTLLAEAYKNAPAASVAPFQYSELILGAVLGYLIWSDVPSVWLLCGAAIIVASGLSLIRHERRASRTMMRAG